MNRIEITNENLKKFIKNLTQEDIEEISYFLGDDYKNKFIDIIKNIDKNTYFYAHENKPVVMGGISDLDSSDVKMGQVWLISTNEFKKHKLEIFKIIKSMLPKVKQEYDILFNFIYKSNFSSLSWINKLGFKVTDTKNKDFKIFYITKGGKRFDLRYITRK